MKKTLSLALAALTTAGLLSVGANAATTDTMLKGTPKLDGKLDDIYKQSLCIHIDESVCTWQYNGKNDMVVDTYMLYDDKNLYVCYVGSDDDFFPADAKFNQKEWGWTNDSIEFHISDGKETVSALVNTSSDFTKLGGTHALVPEFKVAGSNDGKTFTVEFQIALDKLPFAIKAGGEFQHYSQLNDRNNEKGDKTQAMSLKGQNANGMSTYKVSGEAVKVAATKPAAAETFDPATVAIVAAAASCAGIVVSKKRK